MPHRTKLEMAEALNTLSEGDTYVVDSGNHSKISNLYWFELSTGETVTFTPHDSDSTLRIGLRNLGKI